MSEEGEEVEVTSKQNTEEEEEEDFNEQDEEELIARRQVEDNSDSSSEEDEETGITNRYWPPPIEETVKIIGSSGCKTVSALAFNQAGTRFAAGGHDYEVRIWDFEALDSVRPQPINNVQPCGSSVIKQLEFSPNDELILVISGNCQATIIGKDGTINRNQSTCAKGDQYLVDMNKTKGHVQMLNDGCWSPLDKSEFLTCSNDATLRLWEVNKLSQQKTVIKTRSPVSGLKAVPSVCKYSRDGLTIIAGCNDGSVMLWDTRRKFLSTSSCIRGAHLRGSEITGLDYCYTSGFKLVSRSEDETCKLWDLRQLKSALATRSGLTSSGQSAQDCCFSPDDKFILTGTSHSSSSSSPGQLLFLDGSDLVSQQSIELDGASVLRVRWHAKINHIAYSGSDGQVRLSYDRRRSMGGFLSAAAAAASMRDDGRRGTKRKKYMPTGGISANASATSSIKRIITPHALPLFRDDDQQSCGGGGGRGAASRVVGQAAALLSGGGGNLKRGVAGAYRPEMPTSASADGRVKPAGSTLSSYIARNIARPKQADGMNIRDRILRHAEEAAREPLWITSSVGSGGGGVGGVEDGNSNKSASTTKAVVEGGGDRGGDTSCSVGSSSTSSATAQNYHHQQQQQQKQEEQKPKQK